MEVTQKALNANDNQEALDASDVQNPSDTNEALDASDVQNPSDTNEALGASDINEAFYVSDIVSDINDEALVNDITEALGVSDVNEVLNAKDSQKVLDASILDTQKQIESLEKKIQELRSIQTTERTTGQTTERTTGQTTEQTTERTTGQTTERTTEQTRTRTRTRTRERKICNFLTETGKFFSIKVEKDYRDKNKRLNLLLQTMKNVGVPQVNPTKEEEGFLFKGYTLNLEETISLQSACSNYFFFLCKFYLLEHLIKTKEVTTLQEWKCHKKNVEMPKKLPENAGGEKKIFSTQVFGTKFNTWLFPEVNLALLKSIEIIENIENDDTRNVQPLSKCPFTKMYNKGRSKLAKVLFQRCNREAEMSAFCIRQLEQCFEEKKPPQEEEEEKRQKNKRIRELTENTDESEETQKNKRIRALTEKTTDESEEKKFVDATTQFESEHTVDTYNTVSCGDNLVVVNFGVQSPPQKIKENASISKSSAALTDEKDIHKDCYNDLGTGQKSEYKEDNELPAKKAPEELKEEVSVESADEDLPDLPPEPPEPLADEDLPDLLPEPVVDINLPDLPPEPLDEPESKEASESEVEVIIESAINEGGAESTQTESTQTNQTRRRLRRQSFNKGELRRTEIIEDYKKTIQERNKELKVKKQSWLEILFWSIAIYTMDLYLPYRAESGPQTFIGVLIGGMLLIRILYHSPRYLSTIVTVMWVRWFDTSRFSFVPGEVYAVIALQALLIDRRWAMTIPLIGFVMYTIVYDRHWIIYLHYAVTAVTSIKEIRVEHGVASILIAPYSNIILGFMAIGVTIGQFFGLFPN